MKPGSLDYWRKYFGAANSDIFAIIDHAIIIAASDCPNEFRSRRDRIAERLFSCRLTRCSGCHRVELSVPVRDLENEPKRGKDEEEEEDDDDDSDEGEEDIEIDIFNEETENCGLSKESKVNNSRDDEIDNGEVNLNDLMVSNYSFGEAEALTDEIEEESQEVGEVLRIKAILLNCEDEPDSVLFESLRRLQLMALTVDTLKATEIGKVVNVLRKHGSKQICNLARTLIDGWKDLVDEWYNATKTMRGDEGTPESVNPSVVDDEEDGLPSPPLDEGAFFASQPIELSQFFDGMDDDGNPRNSGEFMKERENRRKPSSENHNIIKRKQQTPNEAYVVAKDNKSQQMKRPEVVKPIKPSNANAGPGRPPRQSMEQRSNNEPKLQLKTDKIIGQRKPPSGQHDKLKCSEEVAVQRKLETTKRKLQESYQQAENAKKQRTIQVMELHDLPKQGLVHKNPQMRPGNHNRPWAQGRR